MKIDGIDFPRRILDALRDGKLVIFPGAGVSVGEPAKLPDFKDLATAIAQGTGEVLKGNEPEDQFLGRLQHEGVEVHTIAAKMLRKNCRGKVPKPTDLHRNLLRLYPRPASPRIVTTNFDLLFEQATKEVFDSEPDIFRAPALPLGREFNGIVHVHGALDRSDDMVLTDADFGRAYLTEGWARRFLVELFRSFTVLFVGYSHNDTIMNYMARALPVGETGSRFALTNETDGGRWQVLGIEPIIYPTSSGDDHCALYKGVHGLANYARRSIIDWQREITEIAGRPPTPDEEEMGLIDEALSDPTKTRFFTNAASSVEWIDWLDERKYLDALFGTSELREQDNLLVRWLVEKFACDHADELFLLIGRHNLQLHPKFWLELCRTIGLQDGPPLNAETLSRWVSLLLATAPAYVDKQQLLLGLGECCVKYELMDSIVEIFDALATSRLVIKPGFVWPDADPEDPHPPIDVELAPLSDHYTIKELWENGLKPNLARVAEPLLASVVGHLAAQHRTLCAWQKADREWNPASYDRSAIEPHEQDEYPEAIDVLIDAARDCLEWLALNRPEMAAQWCDQFAGAETPLLRRLAVHTLSVRKDLTPSEKIDWLLARMGLHDLSARHELFRVLQQTYPKASQEQRRVVIEAVLVYRWPREEDEGRERFTAREHFDWLNWLHSAAPDCILAREALDDVLRRYPDFQPRERPDLTHWTSSSPASIGHQSPWTVEELLSRPAGEWKDELLSFQQTELFGPDRIGLGYNVSKAAKQEFEWGLDLADALATGDNWDTDLWNTLMRVWSETELDQNRALEVLHRLRKTELHPKYAHPIAEFLYTLVKDGGTQYTHTLLPQSNKIAANLWRHVDRNQVSVEFDHWLTRAINHAAGILAYFWLHSLQCWRNQQDPKPDALSEEYRDALSEIVQDETVVGRLGRSVLARNFSFLLEVNRHWTKTNLIPLFTKHANVDDYQAVWDGFLYGSLSPPVAELMEDAFLEAVSRIKSDLSKKDRHMFIKAYTTMVGYFAKDPLGIWIPRFFEHADEYARRDFALMIGDHLRDMNDAQQQEWWGRWLKHYWENRLQGVPRPFDVGEIGIMLCWLPDLKTVFPEAVKLAVEMPPVQLTDGSANSGRVVYMINKSDLWQSYPETVAKLLIHLGRIKSRPHRWHKGKELIEKLLQTDLKCELKQKLKELAAKRGLT